MSAEHPKATEIRDLEHKRFTAILNRDLDGFASLCHDDLVYVHSNGDQDSLVSYLTKVAEKHYDYRRIDHPIDRVVVVGDMALVIGSMNADLYIAGMPKRLDNVSLATWARTDGEWKFLSFQATPKASSPSTE